LAGVYSNRLIEVKAFVQVSDAQDARAPVQPTSRESRLARLYQLLLRAARAELRRRSLPDFLEGQQQDDLAHQAGDDALLAITSKLDRFRRESRFAPWADKFVMLEVSAKLGRHYWRNPPVPMSGDA